MEKEFCFGEIQNCGTSKKCIFMMFTVSSVVSNDILNNTSLSLIATYKTFSVKISESS